MSARFWARVRVRVRASTLLKGPKAVGCTRGGDHVARVVVLRGAVFTIEFELVGFRLNVYSSDKYCTPWPNSFE